MVNFIVWLFVLGAIVPSAGKIKLLACILPLALISLEAVIGWLNVIVERLNLVAGVEVLAYISVLPAAPVPDCLPISTTSVLVFPNLNFAPGTMSKSLRPVISLIDLSPSNNISPPNILFPVPLELILPEAVMLPLALTLPNKFIGEPCIVVNLDATPNVDTPLSKSIDESFLQQIFVYYF